MLVTSDGERWDVVDVKRHGGHAVHYVKTKSNDVDTALKSFAQGDSVQVALGEEGLQRRLDHVCSVFPHRGKDLQYLTGVSHIDVYAHVSASPLSSARVTFRTSYAFMVHDGIPHAGIR